MSCYIKMSKFAVYVRSYLNVVPNSHKPKKNAGLYITQSFLQVVMKPFSSNLT